MTLASDKVSRLRRVLQATAWYPPHNLGGTEIYVEKYAPLKDPLELIVKGYHISLRVEEAHQIDVENVM